MSPTSKNTKYSFGFLVLQSKTKQLFVNGRSAFSPTSSGARSSSNGSSQGRAPSSLSSPPTSETSKTSAGKDGSSVNTSRSSSAEHAPPSPYFPSSEDTEPDISVGKMDAPRFRYSKIKASLVPKGWSNDPKKLQAVSANFPHESFGLEDPAPSPLLASTANDGDSRALLYGSAKFYIWHVRSERLFYVTDPYELRGVLRRMSVELPELQVKELQRLPAERFETSSDYLKLSRDEIPKGWYNDFQGLKDLRQIVSAQEYGLSLPLPILTFGGSSLGLAYQLFQSGDRYYIYDQISFDILRINEPRTLQDILQVLDDTSMKALRGLNLENLELLPEYGGPNRVPDNDVPEGWTNKVNSKIVDYKWCRGYGLSICPNTLLYSESYLDGTPAYLFESQPSLRSSNYLWKPSSDAIYRIDGTEGLPDVLAVLKDASKELKLTLLKPLPGKESYRIADDEIPRGWMRVSYPDACEAMPWKKHRVAPPIPILQSVGSTDGRSRFIFQSGGDFYLGDMASNEINRVSAAMGMDSILRVLKDPSQELKLGRVDGPRNLLQ